MSRSSLIAIATFGSIAVAALASVVWLYSVSGVSRFEPAVQALGLLAGLTGVLAERRASARERRHLTIVALADELRRVQSLLADPQFAPSPDVPRPRVYPRLPVSATDAALTSGALAQRGDHELLRLLHNWRDEVSGFNRRLELTEFRIFTSGIPAEVAEFERTLHRAGGYLSQVQRHLHHLRDHLASVYRISSDGDSEGDEPATTPPAV